MDGAPIQMEVMLHPGESAYLDLSAGFILADGDVRAEIRAVLEACSTCRVIPTLEVIDDATGKTAVLYATGKTAVLYAPVTGVCGATQ